MSFFQLRTIPGNAWPIIPNAAGSQLWSVYQGLEQSQWYDADELRRLQLQQVRVLLNHCQHQVAYYGRLFNALGIIPNEIRSIEDFRRVPILSRRTYQEQFVDFCASELPQGMKLTGKSTTTGTAGMPINVWHTNVTNLWWLAFFLRDSQWCGFDLRGKLAAIRTTNQSGRDSAALMQGVTFPYWMQQLDALLDMGPSFGLGIHQPPQHQLNWLRKVDPNYLVSFAGNLEQLTCLLLETGGRLPNLRGIQNISEALTDESQLRIEKAFGVPVKNTYSSSEIGYMASPCPEGYGLHVHAENVLLEVLDAQDNPCAPGQCGRVIVTALHNFLTPFVRYEILDQVTLGAERCLCGRGLPLLTQVEGKYRPMLHCPDGGSKPSRPIVLGLRCIGDYFQHQIIQCAPDHLLIRVVPGRDWSAKHTAQVRELVQNYFEMPIRLEIEMLTQIQIPPGGKLIEVIIECENPAKG